MKTRIYIGTPSGPVQVERIWREEGIAESMVCLKRTTEIVPIGAGYDAFVKRPSGIIEREFGPFEAGAFRLELAASINQGKSWQLAVFAAHALARDGLLAGPDEAFERALWLTGQVDNDLKVGGVTQVPEKIHAALDELDALAKAGKQVVIYVPEENAQALAGASLPPAIEAHAVTTAANILDAIGTSSPPHAAATQTAGVDRSTAPAVDRHRHKRAALGFVFLILGAAVVAAGVILPGQLTEDKTVPPAAEAIQETPAAAEPEPAPEPEATSAAVAPAVAEVEPVAEVTPPPETAPADIASAPDISISEVHPTTGSGCPAVHFGADRGVTVEISATPAGDFTSAAAGDLCALEFTLAPAPGQPYMAAAIELLSGRYVANDPMPTALRGGQPISAPVTWRINLPLRMKAPFEYKMHLVSAAREIPGDIYRSLKIGDFTAADQSGLSITTAHHTVSP